MPRALLWIGATALLGGALFAVIQINSDPSAPVYTAAVSDALVKAALENNRLVKGNPEAKITLTEYSDFQCPACGAYYPIVKQLSEEFGDRVKFSYRQFPLTDIHRNAFSAALAGEAAAAQGKFWEMHDLIFGHQDSWSRSGNTFSIFRTYAVSLGLDLAKFEADYRSSKSADLVNADYAGGVSLGVNSTPTFFINGEKILRNPRSYDEFKSLLASYLQKI